MADGPAVGICPLRQEELLRRKAERKIQHFDDLLTRLHEALTARAAALAEDLRGRYQRRSSMSFRTPTRCSIRYFAGPFPAANRFVPHRRSEAGDLRVSRRGHFHLLEAAKEATRRFNLRNWRSKPGS
jgi:hypothetical protein